MPNALYNFNKLYLIVKVLLFLSSIYIYLLLFFYWNCSPRNPFFIQSHVIPNLCAVILPSKHKKGHLKDVSHSSIQVTVHSNHSCQYPNIYTVYCIYIYCILSCLKSSDSFVWWKNWKSLLMCQHQIWCRQENLLDRTFKLRLKFWHVLHTCYL